MKNIIVVLLLVVILVLVGVLIKNPQPKNEELIDSNSYEIKVLAVEDAYVKFDIKYPYFKNASDEFNTSIEGMLQAQVDENKKGGQENWLARYETQSTGDNISEFPPENEKFSFGSNFTIVQSNSNYISFIQNYGGFTGGAHGYENNVSYNFDIKKQKNIELKDIFSSNFDYLNYLSVKSREYLKSQFAKISEEDMKNSDPQALKEYIDNMNSMIDEGTLPKEENFGIFTFTPDKIKIYFAQYQVGPYVIGMPEVELERK